MKLSFRIRPLATLLALISILPAGVLAQCLPPPSGMVAWWKADGNGNDSIGTNNASVPSGVTYVPAEVGLGFDLEGNTNRILVPDASQLNFGPGQDFSLEAWIQPLDNPDNYTDYSGEIMTVVSKRYAPDTLTALGYEMFLAGGRLSFQMDDNPSVYNNFNAGPDLRDGQFHHVAVTVQRASTNGLQFYVDGQLIATFDPTGISGDLSNTDPLRIGNHPIPYFPAFYRGIIDEVSLYNRALASNEIAAIYAAGSAGKCAPSPALSGILLVYKYNGMETTVTAGEELTFPYRGVLFYQPANTNGAYIGWATIKGKRTYWVSPISQNLLITIPGGSGQSYTLLGDAGSWFDDKGQAHLFSNLIKGLNTTLAIGAQNTFVFPNSFTGENTDVHPDSQTGQMKLVQANSTFTFAAPDTQSANNNGQTLADLINAQIKTLQSQGYQPQ